MNTQPDLGSLHHRLTNLEMLFMHLQRELAALNQVVLGEAQKIEQLERRLRLLSSPPDEDDAGSADE
jgi:uncharacterized coiled-coil protein SlyX